MLPPSQVFTLVAAERGELKEVLLMRDGQVVAFAQTIFDGWEELMARIGRQMKDILT